MIPLPAKDKSQTRAENQRAKLTELFESGVGQNLPGVSGTAWAAYNAVTEYTNYWRTTRGSQERRFESALIGSGADLVRKSVDYLGATA
jgi:hypothetical protein